MERGIALLVGTIEKGSITIPNNLIGKRIADNVFERKPPRGIKIATAQQRATPLPYACSVDFFHKKHPPGRLAAPPGGK